MFEAASRLKIRFNTPRGRLSVEDLWDLPLIGADTCLDDIAKVLHRELKDSKEESFVFKTDNKENKVLQLKFDIVKHVIDVRLEEKKALENAEVLRQKKEQIMAIIAEKESESLKAKDLEELKELLGSM